MSDYLESVKKQFEYYKSLGDKTLAQVPDDKLFWQFNENSNSIAIIVNHLCGNMLSRWTDFLTSDGEKEWRVRDLEFENDLTTRAELEQRWDAGWECLFQTLNSLTEADLQREIYIRNQRHSVLEAINRQLAHYPYHVGQMVFIGKMVCDHAWVSLSIPKGSSGQYNMDKFSKPRHREHFTDEYLGKEPLDLIMTTINALLIIDMQQGCFAPETPRFDTEGVVVRINELAGLFREAGLPVIFIRHDGTRENEFIPGTPQWELLPSLCQDPSDLYIDKYANDVFYHSTLQSQLTELGADTLYITGCATDFCVEATIQSALAKDYNVVVVADGHTTGERPHLGAEMVIKHFNWVWQHMIPTQGKVEVRDLLTIKEAFLTGERAS